MALDIPANDYTLAFYFSLVRYSFVTRCLMGNSIRCVHETLPDFPQWLVG